MTRGKKKCEILKTVRCQVARKNGIPYTYTECTYQGECRGTCPKCEEELRYLTRELEKLKKSGRQVAVAGVAAAVIATTAAGCASGSGREDEPNRYTTQGVPAYTQQEELDGDVAYTPDPEDTVTVEPQGDLLPPEGEMDLGEIPVEFVTAGEPMPMIQTIYDVVAGLQQGETVYISGFERTSIQNEWSQWLAESGENRDIFTVDGVQIVVTYYEDGWSDSVALYGGTTVEDGR